MGRWVIDCGHGGSDSGATSLGRLEKDDVLLVGLKLKLILEHNGETVTMTRSSDATVSLQARVNLEKAGNYDGFISLHRNAGGGIGVETFCYKFQYTGSKKLATAVHEEIVGMGLANRNRGVKEGNYMVLRETKGDAILVEMGFIDNAQDNALFVARYNDYAIAIAKGILKSKGKNYVPIPTPQPKPPVSDAGDGTYWRVIVASYDEKANADEKLKEVQKIYPDAFIAPFKK